MFMLISHPERGQNCKVTSIRTPLPRIVQHSIFFNIFKRLRYLARLSDITFSGLKRLCSHWYLVMFFGVWTRSGKALMFWPWFLRRDVWGEENRFLVVV